MRESREHRGEVTTSYRLAVVMPDGRDPTKARNYFASQTDKAFNAGLSAAQKMLRESAGAYDPEAGPCAMC